MTKLRLAPTLADAIRAAAERHARLFGLIYPRTQAAIRKEHARSFEAGARWAMRHQRESVERREEGA